MAQRDIRFTLVTDGSSDAVLLSLLEWVLRQYSDCLPQPTWADLRRVRQPPRRLKDRIALALSLYPCDLMFVHRDAEKESRATRVEEIRRSVVGIEPPAICVVPVHMQEAWLLFDESAIRRAAGNPRGRSKLTLPRVDRLEHEADPKGLLHGLLREASGLSGRRLKDFSSVRAAHLLGQYIADYSPLRCLPAFEALEEEVQAIVAASGW